MLAEGDVLAVPFGAPDRHEHDRLSGGDRRAELSALANLAAGIVVGKLGTAVASREEIIQDMGL